jgi:hypothetical protein
MLEERSGRIRITYRTGPHRDFILLREQTCAVIIAIDRDGYDAVHGMT